MGRWLRDYPLMLKWQMLSNTPMLALMFIVEALIAVGYVIGFGYIIPNITSQSAMYLVTGAPVLILLMVGLVLVPDVCRWLERRVRLSISGPFPCHGRASSRPMQRCGRSSPCRGCCWL